MQVDSLKMFETLMRTIHTQQYPLTAFRERGENLLCHMTQYHEREVPVYLFC
jgi:hypothetical protein